MRTVKASEVAKGTRVGAESTEHNVTVRIEGEVCESRTINNGQVALTFEDGTQRFYAGDHPVTVLAEPEPEWVEGAWYWVELQEKRTLMRRVDRGWSALADTERAFHEDDWITVLGRVLIVDWPGDDVARTLLKWPDGTAPLRHLDKAIVKVADAIRTQGGAR